MDLVPLPFTIIDLVAFFGIFFLVILFSITPKKELPKIISKLKDKLK